MTRTPLSCCARKMPATPAVRVAEGQHPNGDGRRCDIPVLLNCPCCRGSDQRRGRSASCWRRISAISARPDTARTPAVAHAERRGEPVGAPAQPDDAAAGRAHGIERRPVDRQSRIVQRARRSPCWLPATGSRPWRTVQRAGERRVPCPEPACSPTNRAVVPSRRPDPGDADDGDARLIVVLIGSCPIEEDDRRPRARPSVSTGCIVSVSMMTGGRCAPSYAAGCSRLLGQRC